MFEVAKRVAAGFPTIPQSPGDVTGIEIGAGRISEIGRGLLQRLIHLLSLDALERFRLRLPTFLGDGLELFASTIVGDDKVVRVAFGHCESGVGGGARLRNLKRCCI